MKPTHYKKGFEGIHIFHLGHCKECNLPKVTELNFYFGKTQHEKTELPILPKFEDICDNDCAV
ncbi:MAG: hypothetical protein WCH21_03650 [Bacteroidota bacterium]